MSLTNKEKADLFLVGVILTFVMFTLIAFLMNEGRQYCIGPLMDRFFSKDIDDGKEEIDGVGNSYGNNSYPVQNRRSKYAKTKVDDDFGETREMNTIVEGHSSAEDLQDGNCIGKANVDTTTSTL